MAKLPRGVKMEKGRIVISKKERLKGDDGYKIFSIRIKEATVAALDRLASESNRSRNELINILLEYAVRSCKIVE